MRSRLRKLIKDQSGQSAALGGMLFFILVIFIIFSINAGKIVTDEIHLQQTADLAAYAAAATQADGLNRIRKLNRDNLKDAYTLRQRLYEQNMLPPGTSRFLCDQKDCSACSVPIYSEAEGWIRETKTKIEQRLTEIDRINREYVNKAESSAQATANAMWAGTGGDTRWLGKTDVVMKLKKNSLQFHYGVWCYIYTPSPTPFPGQVNNDNQGSYSVEKEFDVWVQKDDSQMKDTFTVIGVGADSGIVPNNPLAYQKMYAPTNCATGFGKGPDGRCKMSAYAAARPFYGKVGPMEEAQLDNQIYTLADRTPVPAAVAFGVVQLDFPVDILATQLQQQMFQDYRVRLVGVFENQNLNSGRPWSQEIMCPPGSGNCVTYMRH